jgi:hypothetical protein
VLKPLWEYSFLRAISRRADSNSTKEHGVTIS